VWKYWGTNSCVPNRGARGKSGINSVGKWETPGCCWWGEVNHNHFLTSIINLAHDVVSTGAISVELTIAKAPP
jgi:hypothetical protein